MCKAFPNRMQMQHNRFFFPVPLLLFFLVLVLPATAKTTINRGYKTHSFKQAIHLVVVKQSHSFSLPSFFLGAAAFFSAHFVGYSYALPFAFTYIRLLCTTDVAVAAVAAVAVVFFCTLAYETEKKKTAVAVVAAAAMA